MKQSTSEKLMRLDQISQLYERLDQSTTLLQSIIDGDYYPKIMEKQVELNKKLLDSLRE
jgi:hypothetical protein